MPTNTTKRNSEVAKTLSVDYVKLYANTTSWGNIVSMNLGYPGLRAYWTMTSIDEDFRVTDISGQGRSLTRESIPGVPGVDTEGLATYLDFTRASSHFIYRPTELGLDITEDLTIGCWVYFDAESTGVATGILSKWYTTGNVRSYVLYKDANNKLTFSISTDGIVETTITDGGANYITNQWFYIVGRFTPSTELALFVNGMWYLNTTSIPATVHVGLENFNAGRYNRANYLDGRISHAFLSAYSIPNRFICAMWAHSKALFMSKLIFANFCSSSSSTTISSSSSSTSISSSSSSISVSTSSSSISYSTSTSSSLSTSSSTTCSSSSSTISSSSSSEIP